MDKKIILIISIILCLVLTSCSFRTSFGGSSEIEVIEDYRKGTSALDINFIRNNPPLEIFEDSVFAIGVEVKNKGATLVDNAILALSYDSDYLDLLSQNIKMITLDGKNPNNPAGEERNYFYDVKSLFLDPESSKRSLPLMISACYQYQTVLTESICLGKSYDDNYDSGEDVCQVKDYKYSGQGAPVVVESVNLNIISTDHEGYVKPVFDIYIKHVGKGIVTNLDNYGSLCSGYSKYSGTMGVIKITEAKLSDYPLTCQGKIVSLKDDQVRVRCEGIKDVNMYAMPFTAPLSLVIDYGYMDTETLRMEMVR